MNQSAARNGTGTDPGPMEHSMSLTLVEDSTRPAGDWLQDTFSARDFPQKEASGLKDTAEQIFRHLCRTEPARRRAILSATL